MKRIKDMTIDEQADLYWNHDCEEDCFTCEVLLEAYAEYPVVRAGAN